jgi:DNA-binding response OmpR family regulator
MDVLLIEDDPAVRSAYGKALQQHGFKVTAVANAVDAFNLIEKSGFNAIVCDVVLPGLEGTTFYERLVDRHEELADRVVFVTGWGSDEKTKKLLQHTGRPFLTKPVDISQLVSTVTQVVIRSKSEIERPQEHKH